MNVIIYSKNNCPNCIKAKNILKKFNPKIITLGTDITRELFFSKFPNAKQMPQIIIDEKHIGSYEDIEKWLAFNTTEENF